MEAFRLFALTGSVTETASLLRLSQPAVSQTLRDFEAEVGMSLFRKSGRTLQLTAEAVEFLPEVEEFIRHYGRIKDKALELRTGKAGTLTVASIPTLLQHTIPTAACRFSQVRPNIRLSFGSFTAAETARRIKNGLADLGLAFLPTNEFHIDAKPLLRTAITCFLPRDHHLAGRKALRARDLANERIISQGADSPPGYVLKSYFSEARLSEWPSVEANQSHVALSLAASGMGIALTHPLHMFAHVQSSLVAIPFEPRVELTLAVLRPLSASNRVAEEFERSLEDVLREKTLYLTRDGIFSEMVAAAP
ncbi:LysR family transcriptional regulator [Starkeya koreensis]|uniref:LysR family transcriptional regulator n=1 Tax=Ancylobacter koreensis TaxID=266121 RepID=A0ABT0DGP9_9HYPH|nr:LysR family transcriptional regulator [Ancylobacter koreensis]